MKKSILALLGLTILSGCAATDQIIDENVIESNEQKFEMSEDLVLNKSYIVTHIDGEFLAEDLSATMKFGKDNIVTGNGFCNLYSGEYSLNYSGNLEVDDVLSTHRLCDDNRMEAESNFFNMLKEQLIFEQDQLGYKVKTDIGSFNLMEFDAVRHDKLIDK